MVLCLSFFICQRIPPLKWQCSLWTRESPQQMWHSCLYMLPIPTEDVTLLPFKKGDLLILTKKQGLLTSENWVLGQNDRTGKTGLVPTSCLYIIPSVTKPSAQLLVRLMYISDQQGLGILKLGPHIPSSS